MGSFRKIDITNPEQFEVLAYAGSLLGHSKKAVVLACYLPPNMGRKRADKCMEYIAEVVFHVKDRYKNPYHLTNERWKIISRTLPTSERSGLERHGGVALLTVFFQI